MHEVLEYVYVDSLWGGAFQKMVNNRSLSQLLSGNTLHMLSTVLLCSLLILAIDLAMSAVFLIIHQIFSG